MRVDVEIIRFLLVGFVAGWIAAILVRGHVRLRGCIVHTVVGMIGAVVGGMLFRLAGVHGHAAGFVGSVVTATIGAVVLLMLLRLARTR